MKKRGRERGREGGRKKGRKEKKEGKKERKRGREEGKEEEKGKREKRNSWDYLPTLLSFLNATFKMCTLNESTSGPHKCESLESKGIIYLTRIDSLPGIVVGLEENMVILVN